MTDVLVKYDVLTKLVTKKLTKAGLIEKHAEVVADVLVHADLRGVSSHGVMRTEHYVTRIQAGGMNVSPMFSIKETGPCTAIFDGDDGMGHVVMKEAMEYCITVAKEKGIGMITVMNSSHCGALSYFVEQATAENLIGVAMTQTDKAVVPFGGREPYFGTNPMAYGFPAKKHDPVILDMATSNVALGKILHARDQGISIPDDWGVDKAGNPTTDPHQVEYLLPFGGPKGYGLGMVVDIMSGVLAGTAFGPHITKMYGDYEKKRKLGHFVLVIHPAYFTDLDRFLTNVDQMIEEIHQVKPRKGFDQVLVPGEPEQILYKKRIKEGIPISASIYEYLQEN
jgi:ureidoglycolate dehydrogenase (NAD+)